MAVHSKDSSSPRKAVLQWQWFSSDGGFPMKAVFREAGSQGAAASDQAGGGR